MSIKYWLRSYKRQLKCLCQQAKGRRRSRRHTSSTNSSNVSHNASGNTAAERRTSSRLRSRVSSKVGAHPSVLLVLLWGTLSLEKRNASSVWETHDGMAWWLDVIACSLTECSSPWLIKWCLMFVCLFFFFSTKNTKRTNTVNVKKFNQSWIQTVKPPLTSCHNFSSAYFEGYWRWR